jgi:hypothetical protein
MPRGKSFSRTADNNQGTAKRTTPKGPADSGGERFLLDINLHKLGDLRGLSAAGVPARATTAATTAGLI